MRAVVQRVSSAAVSVSGETVGSISQGLLVLLGVEAGDTEKDAAYMADKLLNLRIFDDEFATPNRSVMEISGQILLISQFTLLGDARKGRRPSYIKAARPELAVPLYEDVAGRLSKAVPVETGVFQAEMAVSLVNDGPFTILLDSRKEF